MADKILIPSIEKRLQSLIEVGRRNLRGYSITEDKPKLTVTISREFGCEAYPVTEKLQSLLQEKTKEPWGVMDKALLEEVARNHNVSEEIFADLGKKNRFVDDMISTFSSRWKSDKDYYKLLCKQIVALASGGNVIFVGRGSSILTQEMENCIHFRIVAPMDYKIRSIARRLNMSFQDAEELIVSKQKERESFIKDFLNRDISDPSLYHLIFNNGKNSADRIAQTMFNYITTR